MPTITNTFDSDEQLATIQVDITGAETATLTESDYTESGSGPYTYTATYDATTDGDYTLTLVTAEDAAGNDGAASQSATVTVGGAISAVSLGDDGSGNLSFSFDSDTQLGTATSDIAVTVDGPNTTDVYSFTRDDFSESGSGPYTYALSATQAYGDGNGTYTAVVDTANDSGGTNLANGESDTFDFSSVTVVDDFEDNDITVAGNGAWTNGWAGSTGNFTATTTNAISGTYSGELSSSNEDVEVHATASSQQSPSRVNFSFYSSSRTGNSDDAFQLSFHNSATFVGQVNFKMDGSLLSDGQDGNTQTDVGTWSDQTAIDISVRNIDYTNDEYDIYVDGSELTNGTAFRQSISGFDEIRFRNFTAGSGGSATILVDDVEVE